MLFEDLTFDPFSFYQTFTPIRKNLSVPSNLVPFTRAMSAHHNLDLVISETREIRSDARVELDPKKALILFSGGIDSTWSICHALEQGLTPYPVFIDGLNPANNSRERRACEALCERLGVPLQTYKHHAKLKKLHRSEENLVETPESLAKLQYALLLSKPLILRERIGSILVTVDEDNPIFHNNPYAMFNKEGDELVWFSDTEVSMQTFLPFLSDYIGGEVKGLYPSAPKTEKIRKLFQEGVFEDTLSCILNPMFFAGHRNKPYAPKYENMCGVCWKCKENLKFIAEL